MFTKALTRGRVTVAIGEQLSSARLVVVNVYVERNFRKNGSLTYGGGGGEEEEGEEASST